MQILEFRRLLTTQWKLFRKQLWLEIVLLVIKEARPLLYFRLSPRWLKVQSVWLMN